MNPTTPTIADILRQGLSDYSQAFGPLPGDQLKATHAILSCRTPVLGGHRYECDQCGHDISLYNSCRNRHCPLCQNIARLKWVNARIEELLPVGYFHAVFTIPQELSPFAIRNRRSFYPLLFRAVKETLLQLAQDPKRLGAGIGFIALLHTWGQNLTEHPHVHCIVPGGGLLQETQRWKPCAEKFLFPIAVLQKLFRGKMLDFFAEAVKTGAIQLCGVLQEFSQPQRFKALLNLLYEKTWVVYVKPPFASPQAVVKYLGQYTHRVAISNRRILSMDNGMVTFAYRDYADGYKRKTMSVSVVEFIRRFLLHVLPTGFVKIRHYGFLANRNRKIKLARCQEIFHKKPKNKKEKSAMRHWTEIVKELTGRDPLRCPICECGRLVVVATLSKWGAATTG
jgi:hypothetical protein